MSDPESVLPPGASSGMSDILLRTSCCKISLPLRNAPGGNTDSRPTATFSRHSSQTMFWGLMKSLWLGKAEPL